MTAQTHSPEAYLTRIPQEVLTRITYFIRTPDLCNARLTCRALDKALFHSFAYEFFRKKQFMIYGPSLQCLVDISKHENLSPYLKHVIIGLDKVTPPNGLTTLKDDQEWLNWQLAYADQKALLESGRARDMLAEAFKNLRNLETVDLRDFHSPTRWRDGNVGWTSYGYNTLVESTGVRHPTGCPMVPGDDYPTRLFTLITHALAAAKARPEGIEVVIREDWAIQDHGFLVPTYIEPDYLPVLAGLKRLHLVLDANYPSYSTTKPFYLLFKRFLAHTPNLTWLRLNFRRFGTDYSNEEALLKWLGSSLRPGSRLSPGLVNTDPSFVPLPVELDHLEQLDIGQMHLSASTLYHLFRKFSSTLKRISLHKVKLRNRPDQPSFDDDDDDDDEVRNPWVRLLRNLKKESLPHLKSLLLSFLSAEVTSSTGVTIHYPEVGFVDRDRAEKQKGTPAPGYQTLKGMVHLIRSKTYTGLELETFLSNPAAELSTPGKEIRGRPSEHNLFLNSASPTLTCLPSKSWSNHSVALS